MTKERDTYLENCDLKARMCLARTTLGTGFICRCDDYRPGRVIRRRYSRSCGGDRRCDRLRRDRFSHGLSQETGGVREEGAQ